MKERQQKMGSDTEIELFLKGLRGLLLDQGTVDGEIKLLRNLKSKKSYEAA